MQKIKRISLVVLSFMLALAFAGCAGGKKPDDGGNGGDDTKVHTFSGKFNLYSETDELIAGPFDNVFRAIDEAGVSGKTGYYVKDATNTKVFERGNRNVMHMYTKDKYYGSSVDKKEVDIFLLETPYSHAIIGSAAKYYAHSVKRMNSETQTTYGYEPESGSYVYQFADNGHVKASAIVKLSEVKYRRSQNPDIKSNVYVFFNSNGSGGACDLGVMSGHGHNGKFYAVTNGFEHPLNLPYRNEPISEMTYNAETDEYSGADDIYMEYVIDANGVHMLIRNLRTNVEQRLSEGPSAGSHLAANYATTWMKRTMLHATSYVPDLGSRKIWDPLNGGYFMNLAYEEVKVWKYGSAEASEWYPSSSSTNYGFAYADGGASYIEKMVNGKKQVVHNIFYTPERY